MNTVTIVASESGLSSTNCVYCNPSDYSKWSKTGQYVRILGQNPFFAYKFESHASVKPGTLALNANQRVEVYTALNDVVKIELYALGASPAIALISFSVSFKVKKTRDTMSKKVSGSKVIQLLKDVCVGHLLTINQKIQFKYEQTILNAQVQGLYEKSTKKGPGLLIEECGLLVPETEIQLIPQDITSITLIDFPQPILPPRPPPMDPRLILENLGVGGLNHEFRDIFRRAFASRCLQPETVRKFKISHIKGILLYGPPGTGKTLLARTIANMLNAAEPKIISGPDILSKWVGEAEKRIRELFIDAEAEQRDKADNSGLHVIIFDELDAVCRSRGDSTNNVGDSIVNQLLAKIDGVNPLNNVLIVGMTNRKDLIDRALLRPGRFEVHIEIGLPDERGRQEILQIHTSQLRENSRLDPSVDIATYAQITKNFSGAELAGLVRSATSFALERCLDVKGPEDIGIAEESLMVMGADLDRAVVEIVPAFGRNQDVLEELLPPCGFIVYNKDLENLMQQCHTYVNLLVSSPVLKLFSILLVGPPGSGKTTFAANIATATSIPLLRVITPEEFLGKSEQQITAGLHTIFKDLYRSPLSLLVLDNIERILSYSEIGLRYSNAVLQALLILIKKPPAKNSRLFIIGTTSDEKSLKMLGFSSVFGNIFQIPLVEFNGEKRTMQELLVEIEIDRQKLSPEEFNSKLKKLGKPFLEKLTYGN